MRKKWLCAREVPMEIRRYGIKNIKNKKSWMYLGTFFMPVFWPRRLVGDIGGFEERGEGRWLVGEGGGRDK
jgi:hypothetical protein